VIKFTAIRSPQFDSTALRFELIKEMGLFQKEVVAEFKITTRYWKRGRPEFTAPMSTTKGNSEVSVTVSTDNDLFHYLDKGVPGRTVTPDPVNPMVIKGTYTAKSVPGVLYPNYFGGEVYDGSYARVTEPFYWGGIEARDFSGQIAEMYSTGEKSLSVRLQAVLDHSASKVWSGSGS